MRKAGNEDFSLFMLDFWDEKPPPRLAPDSRLLKLGLALGKTPPRVFAVS